MADVPAKTVRLPGGLEPEVRNRLVIWNGVAAVFHLVQAGLIAVLSTDFALPVTRAILNDDPANAMSSLGAIQPELVFELPTALAVAAFSFLSAVAHGLVVGPYRERYVAYLAQGRNPLRWIEYSVSASIMMVVIAQLTSIFDVVALGAIFACNAAMIGFGHLMERENAGRRGADVRWSAFWMGSAVGAVPWLAIGYHLTIGDPPGFVYAIFVSLFLFFNVFAVNMYAHFRGWGKWADVLTEERTYIVLSFVAKSALAWQVFGGTLRP